MSEVHISGGMFWFWGGAWWKHIEGLPAELQNAVRGIQVLCEPVRRTMPLPPVEFGRRWNSRGKVLLHPTFNRGPLAWDRDTESAMDEMENWLQETGVRQVLVHVDHVPRGEPDLARMRERMPSAALLVENLDGSHSIGTQPEFFRAMLAESPGTGFVLDVAHWYEVRNGDGNLSPWLDDEIIASRLASVHVSTSGMSDARAKAAVSGDLATASHLPAFLNASYPEARWKNRMGALPLISEGCLPPGDLGLKWLAEEIQYLSTWRTPCHA